MLTISQAAREHIPVIANWQVSMAHESEGMKLDLPTVLKGVTKVFDEPHIGFYLVAVRDGAPVGCCLVLKEWSDWRNGYVLWIHSVYTLPSDRGQGVFKAIYNHLKNSVSDHDDLRGLRLYVDRNNKIARQVYGKLGMSCDHYELFEWMK